jgi:pimeloyl-ACP methyl ester carboxylesterase
VQFPGLGHRAWASILACVVAAATSLAPGGCAPPPVNPAFPLSLEQAKVALSEMRESPAPLARPLVIIGGYGDPGIATSAIRRGVASCVAGGTVVTVDVWTAETFEDARDIVLAAVDAACPTDDPLQTVEVDCICHSMGGLVALYAADPAAGVRSLRVARVFCIGTPFGGAAAAALPSFSPIVADMRAGSPFLVRLTAPESVSRCIIVPYTRSDDGFVGARNTAPPGQLPWWVPAEFVDSGHFTSFDDARIQADIARRLRGDPPFTREPRTPLPAIR